MTTGAAGSSGPLVVRLPASARDGGLVEMVECEGAVGQVPVLIGAGPRIELGRVLDAEGRRAAEAPVVHRRLRDRHLEVGVWGAWAMAEAVLRTVPATEGLPGILAAL